MQHPLVSMRELCGLFGKSRQAWYDGQKQEDQTTLEYELLLEQVRAIRHDLPRIGAEKLHLMTADWCHQHGIKIGRDRFTELLKEHNLLVPRRTRKVSTTISHHQYFKYSNLVKDVKVNRPNQLWVSDITYIQVVNRFSYLSLITDAYSKKIVGWALKPNLGVGGPVAALRMALAQKGTNGKKKLIHHSDRGIQYCSKQYTSLLLGHDILISMTSQNESSENQIAERVNRTIKEEILENRGFHSHDHAAAEIERAIKAYNLVRPHSSCDYLTPEKAHLREGELRKKWRLSNRHRQRKIQIEELEEIS
ncbi:IS3 family transposase [Rudanella lutea]|uniref:IS3 family transposase n=1 Tax=Rudanella lutea TaxID=451374 RepID=UPI00035CCD0F|nr:IS3 family transposase [Rudanella lutea]